MKIQFLFLLVAGSLIVESHCWWSHVWRGVKSLIGDQARHPNQLQDNLDEVYDQVVADAIGRAMEEDNLMKLNEEMDSQENEDKSEDTKAIFKQLLKQKADEKINN